MSLNRRWRDYDRMRHAYMGMGRRCKELYLARNVVRLLVPLASWTLSYRDIFLQ